MLPNGSAALALFFAAMETGLYVVPVNWHLAAAEVAYILGDSGAGAFVAHERFAAVATAAADQAGIGPDARFAVGAVPGFAPLAELGAGGEGRPAAAHDGRSDGLHVGHLGPPQGRAARAHRRGPGRGTARSTAWFFGMFGLTPFDGHVHLCCSPLYHTAVLNFATISLQLGHPVVLMDRFDPETLLALIERHRGDPAATWCRRSSGGCSRCPSRSAPGTTSARCAAMIHGAAPCPQEVKRRMLDWWGPVVDRVLRGDRGRRHRHHRAGVAGAAGIGRHGLAGLRGPHPRRHGDDVPAGEPGLVYMRMGSSTFDYHKDEEKTLASRARGMFTVGDIGYLDADGYLYLCDRKSDMIISGGVNIYPAEIEAELSCHPAVADVAVFGIPHEEWGEEIKAVVQPADGPPAGPGPDRGAAGLPRRPDRPLQAAEDHRLRRGTAARPQRQALQAPPPRPVLDRPRPPNLKTKFIHQNEGVLHPLASSGRRSG